MTDYVLKYQVWSGLHDGKLATFRDEEAAMRFLLGVKSMYPDSYIYNSLTEGYIGKDV